MNPLRTFWLASALVLPMGASAADLGVILDGSLTYDDNIFKRQRREQDDFLFRGEPRITFTERSEDLVYDLGYRLAYERGFEERDVNDIDQRFDGNGSFALTDRTRIFGSDKFSLDRSRSNQLDIDGDLEVSSREELIKRNDASLGVNHAFTARTQGALSIGHFWRDTSIDNRSRVNSFSASGNLTNQLTAKHQVGVGLGYVKQRFDDSTDQPDSESDIYRVNGIWRWVLDETTSFDLTAGPSLVETDQDLASSESSLSIFGAASLSKRWTPKLSTTASYQRRESTASGLGGTAVLDAVTVDFDWEPIQHWRFRLRGNWSQRKSVSDVFRCPSPPTICTLGNIFKDDRAINTEVWRAIALLHYRWSERVLLRAQVNYTDQQSRANTAGDSSDFDNLLALVGIRYTFGPIQLW